MLSTRWVRFRTTQDGQCQPMLLDPRRPDNLALAEALTEYLRSMTGKTRAAVDEGMEPLVKGEGRMKVARGLVEVLLDRCGFEQAGDLDPVAVREVLFRLSMERFPVGSLPEMGRRTEILAEAGVALGATPADLERALYADLKAEQRLIGAPDWSGEDFLFRYNAALVQAVLLRAEDLTITLSQPEPARIRQLVRYLRFFELLHMSRLTEGGVILTVDGPGSVLSGAQRYGLSMARFFPALLLQDRFRGEATIKWPGKRGRMTLIIEPSRRLRSWYPDTGAWAPKELTELSGRLVAAAGDGWEVLPGEEVEPLGGQTLLIPDLILSGPGGRRLRIEVLWPHRHRGLGDYLDAVAAHAPADVLVCVVRPAKTWKRKVMAVEESAGGRVLFCARTVPVARLVARARLLP
ncbi:MAG: DUF790 family protein [Pseudomonadota bacterium]